MTGAIVGAIGGRARPWGRALRWLLFLGPFFFLSYGAANWLATMRADVGSIVYAWEASIPFVPWTIIPYWSIDVLYGISLFVCTSEHELDTHARRLLTAQVIAVACFILFPLRFTFVRPEVDGLAGVLFDSLGRFDKPFNQAPSLHIALLVVLWDCFARHMPRWARLPLHVWFALIAVSVLTTYQHHFIDVPTGALLGFFCLWVWPVSGPSPVATPDVATDTKRWWLAACYATSGVALGALAGGLGGAALWLFWPAISLVLVAVNYAVLGASGFQKGADGYMSIASRCLLAPYITAAWINSRLWTRKDPDWVEIGAGVMLGRLPSRSADCRHTTVIDVCAELPRRLDATDYQAVPLLDLIVPLPSQLRHIAATIERARSAGPVLVCCALGYSRSAAAVATWLLMSGRAVNADIAIELIRQARPRVVLGASASAVIAAAEAQR